MPPTSWSLVSWLRALFPKRTPATPNAGTAPPGTPDAGAETVDNDVRMHIAAHDPAFPAKREAAVDAIVAAIDTVAQAHGFTKKAKSWAKTGDLGTVSIHLQRSRYGFDCHINLGFQPLTDDPLGPWAEDSFVPLEAFFPEGEDTMVRPATLTYLDVHEDGTNLADTMHILSERALPWLLAHLTDPNAHNRPKQTL
ncbi:DUF4304 domain-containing protein [Pseudorhodobacter sp. W20_MBD10_FR17]|uniref:DUF4304 domain-containing protein n=1 Tax=Pseudorhodobacter sp. W20_MBD10_FR17 TaxID=3240266 RepID=UPI003F96400C